MNCKEFSNLLDAFVDDSLAEKEAAAMRNHMAACRECESRYTLALDLRQLDREVTVPAAFSQDWRKMVREENSMEKTSGMKKKWQNLIAVAAALVFVVGGTMLTRDDLAAPGDAGNGNAYRLEDTSYSYSTASNTAARGMMYSAAPKAMAAPGAMMDTVAEAESGDVRAEKIIRNASFTIKTLAFDADVTSLQNLAVQMGGRVEYMSTSGDKDSGEMRYGSFTLRIPAVRLDEFLSGAHNIGRLTALQQEEQDVTASYYDVQARLDTQLKKMERLQSLLLSAQDISDLIEIENSIADTQYMIDSYTAQLKNYDGKVDYSTVRVTVQEIQVQEAVELSLGQRMIAGLKNSLKAAGEFLRDCAIFLVAASPWLAALGVIVVFVVLIRKRNLKKKEGNAK